MKRILEAGRIGWGMLILNLAGLVALLCSFVVPTLVPVSIAAGVGVSSLLDGQTVRTSLAAAAIAARDALPRTVWTSVLISLLCGTGAIGVLTTIHDPLLLTYTSAALLVAGAYWLAVRSSREVIGVFGFGALLRAIAGIACFIALLLVPTLGSLLIVTGPWLAVLAIHKLLRAGVRSTTIATSRN